MIKYEDALQYTHNYIDSILSNSFMVTEDKANDEQILRSSSDGYDDDYRSSKHPVPFTGSSNSIYDNEHQNTYSFDDDFEDDFISEQWSSDNRSTIEEDKYSSEEGSSSSNQTYDTNLFYDDTNDDEWLYSSNIDTEITPNSSTESTSTIKQNDAVEAGDNYSTGDGQEYRNPEDNSTTYEKRSLQIPIDNQHTAIDADAYDKQKESHSIDSIKTPSIVFKELKKTKGKKTRRFAAFLGVISILLSVSVVGGIVFGLLAIILNWIGRLITCRKQDLSVKLLVKKRCRAGTTLGIIGLILSIIIAVSSCVFFGFYASFADTMDIIIQFITGGKYSADREMLKPIIDFYDYIRSLVYLL